MRGERKNWHSEKRTAMTQHLPLKAKGTANKQAREKQILLGLVDYFLKTGKPVGSSTLKEAEFGSLSSATIRNYFSTLEQEGYLEQLHTSGGRIPTTKALRFYANEVSDQEVSLSSENQDSLNTLRKSETKELALYLQKSAETLSQMTGLAVFLSAPRFDHDFVTDLRVVPIDTQRMLSILITDFGVIQTEVMHTDQKFSHFAIKRIEKYFQWRLTGQNKPEEIEPEEEKLAKQLYNEIMVRYIVGYSNFLNEEVCRTGFSKLLHFPEFQEATALAGSLGLFENAHGMRMLLRDCMTHETLRYWIGGDLNPFSSMETSSSSVAAIPYRIGKQIVGAAGVLGPKRIPYKEVFSVLKAFSESISEAITRNLYKHKIHYRQPQPETAYLQKEEHRLIGQSPLMLLEDQRDT